MKTTTQKQTEVKQTSWIENELRQTRLGHDISISQAWLRAKEKHGIEYAGCIFPTGEEKFNKLNKI